MKNLLSDYVYRIICLDNNGKEINRTIITNVDPNQEYMTILDDLSYLSNAYVKDCTLVK